MKKTSLILAVLLVMAFSFFALASMEDESETADQGTESAENGSGTESSEASEEDPSALGDLSVVIDSCRIEKNSEGTDIAIIKYIFTNVSNDEEVSFSQMLHENVFQDDVELSRAIFAADDLEYAWENQTKFIKKGETIEVEEAYILENTTSDIYVKVNEWVSLDYKIIEKTFSIGDSAE